MVNNIINIRSASTLTGPNGLNSLSRAHRLDEAMESIRSLQRQLGTSHPPELKDEVPTGPTESPLHWTVRQEVEYCQAKDHLEREGWFNRYTLPPASVLARQSSHDRDALIAHFRAKELRRIADAVRDARTYDAGLARKRLQRVNELAAAFAEVTGSAI